MSYNPGGGYWGGYTSAGGSNFAQTNPWANQPPPMQPANELRYKIFLNPTYTTDPPTSYLYTIGNVPQRSQIVHLLDVGLWQSRKYRATRAQALYRSDVSTGTGFFKGNPNAASQYLKLNDDAFVRDSTDFVIINVDMNLPGTWLAFVNRNRNDLTLDDWGHLDLTQEKIHLSWHWVNDMVTKPDGPLKNRYKFVLSLALGVHEPMHVFMNAIGLKGVETPPAVAAFGQFSAGEIGRWIETQIFGGPVVPMNIGNEMWPVVLKQHSSGQMYAQKLTQKTIDDWVSCSNDFTVQVESTLYWESYQQLTPWVPPGRQASSSNSANSWAPCSSRRQSYWARKNRTLSSADQYQVDWNGRQHNDVQ